MCNIFKSVLDPAQLTDNPVKYNPGGICKCITQKHVLVHIGVKFISLVKWIWLKGPLGKDQADLEERAKAKFLGDAQSSGHH